MSKFICETCGRGHHTNEHRIYEKLKLAEMGVPIETLFVMPDEETGNPQIDEKLNEIKDTLNKGE